MDRRRTWVIAFVAVVGAAALALLALVWSRDDDTTSAGPGTTTTTPATTTSTATSTTIAAVTTTSSPATSTTQAVALPATVVVGAAPGGGSGEVAVHWDAVAGATGYRVLRSDAPDGAYEVRADVDVITGATNADEGVTNVFSAQHVYVPDGGALAAPDRSARFDYVEVGGPEERCFQVIAVNAGGESAPSEPACASPP
jgi:hypothetical protein